MAEEVKEVEKCCSSGKAIKTALKVLLGIVLLALGLFLVWKWMGDLFVLIRGGLGLFLILVSVITLAIAKE